MVPWKLCPCVKTKCPGKLGRTGTLASHCHTCPCPHGTVEIKALLFLEGETADGRNLHKSWNCPPGLFSLVVPLGDTAVAGLKGREANVSLCLIYTVLASLWPQMISLSWISFIVPLYWEQRIYHLPVLFLWNVLWLSPDKLHPLCFWVVYKASTGTKIRSWSLQGRAGIVPKETGNLTRESRKRTMRKPV